MAERLGLRELVFMVWEDEVEPAAVDLERWSEQLLGEHRALDVPARPATPPGRVPRGVLTLLVRLPEGEVARILLQRVRLLLLDLSGSLAGEASVLGEARDAEVDVALDGIRMFRVDQGADEADDLRHVVGDLRHRVGHAEPEAAGVGEVPPGPPHSARAPRAG